ncbi:universal stress protein [Aquiflexum sp. TKW24L]|uniref:universal stress protein n=1 Tax=Aquiflexum sp. TKW24L TaxID=2942212 RepID=UPI0020BE1C14|nr:universal stress protein [Aquiflexum sp. TKW24L]MCL6259060.1 universal stress protein [Aquiflexum sp. TKW24L]
MKILVPTDFSDNANNALEYALNIAVKEKASITLLFAFYAVYDFASQATEIVNQIEADARKALKKSAAKGKELGIDVDYRIVQGTVASTVTALAYREEYDLIVMGTQGASGIKKALIGSNTGHVIKESKVSILAVPQNAKWENWSKISTGLELDNEEEKFFTTLFQLTGHLDLPYEFFHVKTDESFEKDLGLIGLEEVLNERFKDKKITFIVQPATNVNAGIESYLKKNKGSILVMFYKNKTFFEYLFNKSASLEMAYHTDVPLLVIK